MRKQNSETTKRISFRVENEDNRLTAERGNLTHREILIDVNEEKKSESLQCLPLRSRGGEVFLISAFRRPSSAVIPALLPEAAGWPPHQLLLSLVLGLDL